MTDDIVWYIHGHRTTHGKAEFDDDIENPAFDGSPDLDARRVFEDGNAVVLTGEGRRRHRVNGPCGFAFSDLLTFRGDRIERVDSEPSEATASSASIRMWCRWPDHWHWQARDSRYTGRKRAQRIPVGERGVRHRRYPDAQASPER